MANDRVDPEDIAALLDGTLGAAERERVVAVLGHSEESYDDLLEAVAIQAELAAAPAVRSGARWRRPRTLGIATALIAAGLVIAVFVARRESDDERMLALVASAVSSTSASGSVTAVFGTQWNAPPWSETRGASDASAHLTAFRAGVRFAELRAALASRDSVAAQGARRTLIAAVENIEGGRLIKADIEDFESESDDAIATMSELRSLVSPSTWFDLGAWIESARLATIAGRSAFFSQDGAAISELRRILARSDKLPLESRARIDVIVAPLRHFLTSDVSDLAHAQTSLDLALKAADR